MLCFTYVTGVYTFRHAILTTHACFDAFSSHPTIAPVLVLGFVLVFVGVPSLSPCPCPPLQASRVFCVSSDVPLISFPQWFSDAPPSLCRSPHLVFWWCLFLSYFLFLFSTLRFVSILDFLHRYRPRVRVVRVTGRTMCDAYFIKNREKVR